MAALLFGLMIAQAALVIVFYRITNIPILAALHPVNALIVLGLTFHLARGVRIGPAEQTATARVQ
jgi:succinate dehydrogenase/fumarate reductase cytochrome b subunit